MSEEKNIYSKKIGPSEDWSHICPLIERCLCCWIGVEKCSIGGLSFQFWLDLSNPPQIFNGDQIVLQPNPTIGPSFCCQHQRNYEISPPALSRKFCTSFCEVPKQLLLVAGFWGNRFCTVDSKPPLAWTVEQLYSWLPPLAWASWWPVRARMSENRTFSGSRARQQVL